MYKENNKLLEEKRGDVLILFLNRPEQGNSLDRELFKRLKDIFEEIKWDESVKVVILTGSGDKYFCGGIDLKERSNMNEQEILLYREKEIIPFFQVFGE